MNALADVLACLGAVVTGIGVVLLSVAIRRIERRLGGDVQTICTDASGRVTSTSLQSPVIRRMLTR